MDSRHILASIVALSCAVGCAGGRLMQLTSPGGAKGRLYPLTEVPADLWPKAPPKDTPLYVTGTLRLAPPAVDNGGNFFSWLGSKMKAPGVGRIDLTFIIDPKRTYTSTILMDDAGTAVALQRNEDGEIESTSLLSGSEKEGKSSKGAPGVPLWVPKWVDRFVYVNVSITQLPPEATASFKDAVGALVSAGSTMLPDAASAPMKSFAQRFSGKGDDKDGPRPMSIDLTMRRSGDCRSGRDCSTVLADQTLVYLERPQNEPDFIKGHTLAGVQLLDSAGKPYPGMAAFVEVHVERLPDTLLSAECRAQLSSTQPVDEDDLEKDCPSDNFAPSDKLLFEPLRAAIAKMRADFPDREHRARAFSALEKRAKVCNGEVSGWPTSSAVCTAALGLLDRARQDDPTIGQVVAALKSYGDTLRPLDNLDLKGDHPCQGFVLHDQREREAEESLRTSAAIKDSGCLISHPDDHPIRCKELPSLEETSSKYRDRRQKLAEACAFDRLAKAPMDGHPDRELARAFILDARALDDLDWAVMRPRADQPLGTEPPDKVCAALQQVMNPDQVLPPSQRINQLLERTRHKLESLTLDYGAALRSYQAFLTAIDVDGLKALAQQLKVLAAQRLREQWLKDLLRDADKLANLQLNDLFEGSKDSYKVLGNWEDLRGKSTQVHTLLQAAIQELNPHPVPVEPGPPPAVQVHPASAPAASDGQGTALK